MNRPKSLEKRITDLLFHGTGDEAYELFSQTCSYCYCLAGLGMQDKAEIVCEWAEEMAESSKGYCEDGNDAAYGHWGR